MAITKYKVIKKNLDTVINYAMNGEKTENGMRFLQKNVIKLE